MAISWEDKAIILSAKKFNERDLIATVFSHENGIYSGVVRAGQGKTKLPIYQQGNIVKAHWKARLEEQLGNLSAETTDSVSAKVINDRQKLKAVISLVTLIKTSLAERDPHPHLYTYCEIFLEDLYENQNWIQDYVKFEIELLRECGFGLDFSKCAATGSNDNLEYISPKTGRAVSSSGAVGYEDKLFKIPEYDDYISWLKITEHFLEKNVYYPQNRQIPDERQSLVEILRKA